MNGKDGETKRFNLVEKKKNFNIKDNLGNDFKEIIELYEEIKKLANNQEPKYDYYIKILKKGINDYQSKKNKDELLFEWDKEINIKKEKYKRKRSELKNDNDIKELFKGYPEEIIEIYLQKFK